MIGLGSAASLVGVVAVCKTALPGWMAVCKTALPGLLAQAPDISGVEGDFLKSWLIVGGFVVMIGIQIYTTALRGVPQKREVSGEIVNRAPVRFALKEEVDHRFDAVEKDMDELRSDVKSLREHFDEEVKTMIAAGQERVRVLRTEITAGTDRIHGRIDEILKACSRLEGSVDALKNNPRGGSKSR